MTYRKTQLLDGFWEFGFTAEADFSALADLKFQDLQAVPGCYDAQPNYFCQRGCGAYRRQVQAGGRQMLEIGAAGLQYRVYWDGQEIFRSATPYLAEKIIFSAGEDGTHVLLIAVCNLFDRTPSSQFQEFYDFYAYGGIYRSVRLTAMPAHYLDYCAVTTRDYRTGRVRILLETAGDVPAEATAEIFCGSTHFMIALQQGKGESEFLVPDFQCWSPDNPALQQLQVRIAEDTLEVTFGIREVKVEKAKILLNGQPLQLIGYNRHDSHPQFGAALPSALLLADLNMIKQQNCNFIRGCHYPQSEEMLSLCDRLGLLVWEETLGWGNGPEALADAGFQSSQCRQAHLMVRKSINHPCVILYGFLNEAHTHLPVAQELVNKLACVIRAEDETRLITYATCRPAEDCCLAAVDVLSFNIYPGWYDDQTNQFFQPEVIEQALAKWSTFASEHYPDKPLLISEIGASALPGDHSGLRWSEEYQAELLLCVVRYIRRDQRYSGVALWQFCNCRTYVSRGAQARPRGFNNKGVVDEFRRPKLAWQRLTTLLQK